MASILNSIEQQVTAGAVQQISQRLGVDPAVAQRTVNAAIPAITAAIAAHANAGGAATIHREATKQVENPQSPAPLPDVLGANHAAAEQRVSEAAGVSREQAGQILSTIAPAVLRGIGQHVQQEGFSPTQLANVLSSAIGGSRTDSASTASEARP